MESLENVRYVSDDFDDRVEESEEMFLEDCEPEVTAENMSIVPIKLNVCTHM